MDALARGARAVVQELFSPSSRRTPHTKKKMEEEEVSFIFQQAGYLSKIGKDICRFPTGCIFIWFCP